jgi:hypothetical protein
MRSSSHTLLLIGLAACLAGCARMARVGAAVKKSWIAAGQPSAPPAPQPAQVTPKYAAHTATLGIIPGLRVLGVVDLPRDFVPDMNRAPLWLHKGSEVAVLGTIGGRSTMLAFSGAGLIERRIIIRDFGAGASSGWLLDVAPSSDGEKLAAAEATSAGLRLKLSDSSDFSTWHKIAALRGDFASAQLTWLNRTELILATYATSGTRDQSLVQAKGTSERRLYSIKLGEPGPKRSTGLRPKTGSAAAMSLASRASVRCLDQVHCELSRLALSPDQRFAIAQGEENVAPPALIDLQHSKCRLLGLGGPIRVLAWAPKSNAFLYTRASQGGVFKFDLDTGRITTIAVSSGAAAYASDGTIIALGSQALSWTRAARQAHARVKAQIALSDRDNKQITINSLGFVSEPALLAQSTMVFSIASNDALIDTAVTEAGAPLRQIIEYSYPSRAAFVIARGAAEGPVAMSWSQDGKLAAIVDGDATRHTLTVLAPPA